MRSNYSPPKIETRLERVFSLAGVLRGIRTWFAGATSQGFPAAMGIILRVGTNWHNRQFANETVKKPQRNLGLLSLVDYFGIRVF